MKNLDEIIEMAWCDKTSFDDIKSFCNLEERDVIKLMRKNLKGSNLQGSTLKGSILIGTDLSYSNLFEVNLTSAFIRSTNFCNTIMPNGEKSIEGCSNIEIQK